ncbi:MAG: DUF1002 domain-containing protein [Lachnospiraceae bacterium]|nr:DUF1002 domain-containing protein [Lachnospiraceae bacterium]
MKRSIVAIGLAVSLLAYPMTAFAEGEPLEVTASEEPSTGSPVEMSDDTQAEPAEETKAEKKPFISLGKDLTDEQLDYVLGEMGITRDDLANYRVYYVTNQEEHEKLDSYIDPSVIGSISLSSVMVKENNPGYGIKVSTRNIDYCTVSMYKNALLTAGVKDADVLVVGPFPISGTAALIGAWHAYEEMTGEELVDEAKDTALNEMIVTASIVDSFDDSQTEKVQELVDYVKASVIAEGIENPEDVKEIIEKAEGLFGIDLNEDQTDSLSNVMGNVAKLDIDPSVLLEQAGDMYDKYGETILAGAKDAINGIITDEVKATIWDSIKNILRSFFKSITDYFKNL